MATTFAIRALGVERENSHLNPVIKDYPEAAGETFLAGALVIFDASGFITECASTPAEVFGVAVEDAHNSASAGDDNVHVVPLQDGDLLTVNLLEAAAADHVLAEADRNSDVDLILDADLLGTGKPGWYALTPAAVAGQAKVVSFYGDQLPTPTGIPTRQAKAGDTNARVRVQIFDSILRAD